VGGRYVTVFVLFCDENTQELFSDAITLEMSAYLIRPTRFMICDRLRNFLKNIENAFVGSFSFGKKRKNE